MDEKNLVNSKYVVRWKTIIYSTWDCLHNRIDLKLINNEWFTILIFLRYWERKFLSIKLIIQTSMRMD